MKFENTDDEVFISNASNNSAFTVNANGQMFKILSDGLYQYKEAAVIRELCCNAYDSHVEAGKADVPFMVNFPNQLHHFFEVEDFGVGLDDEGIRNVYAGYFNSTKTNTNDLVGAFGLGSKTPFIFTTTFTIRSRHNGIERTYNAFLGSDKVPQISLVATRQTEHGNGIKVSIPVNPDHAEEFTREAAFIFSFFKVKPITNFDPFLELAYPTVLDELNERGYSEVFANHYKFRSALYGRDDQYYAVIGTVAYPIDIDNIRRELDDEKRSIYDFLYTMNDVGRYNEFKAIFVRFEIGELEIAPSRESLSLDERTKQKVIDKINSYFDTIIDSFKQNVKKLDTSNYINLAKSVYELMITRPKPDIHIDDLFGDYACDYKNYQFSSLIGRYMRFLIGNELCSVKPNTINCKRLYKLSTHFVLCSMTNPGLDCNVFVNDDKALKQGTRFHVIVAEDGKTVGIKKMIQSVKSDCTFIRSNSFMITTRKTTERFKNYLQTLLPGWDIVYHSFKDVRERYKTPTASKTWTRKDNEVNCVSLRYSADNIDQRFNRNCFKKTTVDLQNSKSLVYYVDRIAGDNVVISGKTVEFNNASDFVLLLLSAFTDMTNIDNFYLIVSNKNSEARIKRNNIKHFDEFVMECIDNNREKALSMSANHAFRTIKRYNKYKTSAMLTEKIDYLNTCKYDDIVQDANFEDQFLECYEAIGGDVNSSMIGTIFSTNTMVKDIDGTTDITFEYLLEKYIEELEKFIEEYPFVSFLCGDGFINNKKSVDKVIEVIKNNRT